MSERCAFFSQPIFGKIAQMSLAQRVKSYGPDLLAVAAIGALAVTSVVRNSESFGRLSHHSAVDPNPRALDSARQLAAKIRDSKDIQSQSILELGVALLELSPYQRNIFCKEIADFAPAGIRSTVEAVNREQIKPTREQMSGLYWLALSFNIHVESSR